MSIARAARGRWILLGLFILSLPLVNPYLRGDGNGYYAYLRSAVIDRDFDFENEFRRGDPLFQTLYFDERGDVRPLLERGGVAVPADRQQARVLRCLLYAHSVRFGLARADHGRDAARARTGVIAALK